MPPDFDSGHPVPRERGRSQSAICLMDLAKTTILDVVTRTQPPLSPREMIGIGRARVPCNLLHPYDTTHPSRNP